ncbi:MAG: hypothetical protein HKP27_05500, partial [Myxococcales bacterium]|nr:hypothetical protein [Myxococcales bacterium]
LVQVKLSFWERVQLYQAFVDTPAEPEFWKLVLQLNTLRNDMAHDLEPSDFRLGVVEFTAAVEAYTGFPPEDFDDAQRLRTCIVHLLRALVDLRDVPTG